jgi:sugar phosphate isomerase/epimerase
MEVYYLDKLEFGMPTLIELQNLDECVSLCVELGLQFIEINMNLPQYQIEKLDFDMEQLKRANRKGVYFTLHLDENLNVADFNSKVSQAYIYTVLQTIEFGKKTSIPILNMHMAEGVYFTLPDRKVYLFEQYNDFYMASLMSFRTQCEKLIDKSNLKICIENCGDKPFVKKGIELLLESNVFQLTFDIGHSYSAKNIDEPFIISNKDRLCHMHIHDATPNGNHQVLGTGDINIEEKLILAKSQNCRCVIETKSVSGLRKSVDYLRRIKAMTEVKEA